MADLNFQLLEKRDLPAGRESFQKCPNLIPLCGARGILRTITPLPIPGIRVNFDHHQKATI
jgi:hypothetical protein